ncbi:MAG: hypothetical protein JSR59_13690 [Proteobacteria bacterium]|nr:hypothetical protein [Pseudomonadota bacterium]
MALQIDAAARAQSSNALPRLAWGPALIAFGCGAGGLALAAHYPLQPFAALALFVLATLVAYRYPNAWPLAVPALLPVIGFAPWTGWITFEELDLLVLAMAAGGYAWLASHSPPSRARPRGAASLVWLVVALLVLSMVAAMLRGFADAGGFEFGWFEGYRESMNSVRIAKALGWALLLFPLWVTGYRMAPLRMGERLVLGLVLGLGGASLAALWERVAFPGLLNFSTDYRTTALFWEMHVGGAALDGWLAMTVPFAVLELMRTGSPRRWTLTAAIAILGGYACMTTFSRGVYLAVPLGVAATLLLFHREQVRSAAGVGLPLGRHVLLCALFAVAFGIGADQIFPTSGYRGMLALLGAAVLLLPLGNAVRRLKPTGWIAGLLLGVVFAMVGGAIAWMLPKGAYLAYTASWLFTVAALWIERRPAGRAVDAYAGLMALAGYVWVLTGVAMVAYGWAGEQAMSHTLWPLAVLILLAVVGGRLAGHAWPASLRWQATTAGAMVVAGMVVAAFGGGAYMTGRFATSSEDLDTRILHWKQIWWRLKDPVDLTFGKGLGRFMDNYALTAPTDQRPADYRLHADGDRPYMRLIAGTHVNGWGEILRVSQRVTPPIGPAVVQFDVRADGPVTLHFEVCQKHLLYDMGCLTKRLPVVAKPGEWQTIHTRLDGEPLSRGAWYAPRLVTFAMATESSDHPADLDNVSLVGADGRNLLVNGDFSDGMARWFFSSDRYHMPWHAKNLAFAVLFDQGLVGLTLFAVLVAGALWRVALGHARGHPLAPGIAGAIVGFVAVGAFDSLVDVPRVAFVFYLLVLLGLTLRTPLRGFAPTQPPSGPVRRAGRAARHAAAAGAALFAAHGAAQAAAAQQLIEVGPQRAVKTIAAAAAIATDGATVQVDAGDYRRDVAVWNQSHLVLRAVGGRARLIADGAAAERKGIWVMRGEDVRVQGFDFIGATVPDRNGAGIRLESGSLRVVDCSFVDNEMGILTNNDGSTVLSVEDSEFARNTRADGANHHNLYAGTIRSLDVSGSYFHHAGHGHLLKSRAALNRIAYNRLADGSDGHASYELEFPNGGIAVVVGNLIEQSRETENDQLVSYGAEGYRGSANQLYLVHNTLVDPLPAGGVFLRVWPGSAEVHAIDNLVVGQGRWEAGAGAELRGNVAARPEDFDPGAPGEYRLKRSAPAWGRTVAVADVPGMALTPTREYASPHRSVALDAPATQPGAVQRPAAAH